MSTMKIVERRSYFIQAGDEILDPSEPADFEKIVTLMSAPSAVGNLANWNNATSLVELLKAMKPEQQVGVLSAPEAERGLVGGGQADAVADIRRSLAPQVPGGARNNAKSGFENRMH